MGNDRRDPAIKPQVIMHNFYSVFPPIAMLAAMQLDMFSPLHNGPMRASELASALDLPEEKITPLLYALVAGGVMEVNNGVFSNTPESAIFLSKPNPEYIGGIADFFAMLWDVAGHTAESVRTGAPQAKHDFHNLTDAQLLAYFKKQIHSSISGGREIAEKFDFSPYQKLLDAGGGSGGVSIAVCDRYPQLRATVADLQRVTEVARHFIDEACLSGRINTSSTDLCRHSPEGSYDVAVVRALIQTLSLVDARKALQNIGRSMTRGGRIYIFGNVLDNSMLGPPSSIAFSLVFLNVYDHGHAYTENEYREMLTNAGFGEIKIEYDVLSDGMGMVTGRKK